MLRRQFQGRESGGRERDQNASDRTRGNQHKLKEIEFNQNTKKKMLFCCERWGQTPPQVVQRH